MERATPFGKYWLLERINVGGMAEVFKAKTVGIEGFEKLLAIKRILPSVAEDQEFIEMFIDEAKITSSLSHANVAQTFDLGKIDGSYYIAMEYVPGKDLRAIFERLQRRGERFPLPLAACVVARICEGLDYAHRKRDPAGRDLRIVHRDVSPQNVIVSFEGEVKLVDFGIAKAASKITKTQAGILKGKSGYMSPEQVRGLPLDRRSDVFAAGVVLYELCTGERLFTGESERALLEKVREARVVSPSRIEPAIPLELERIILQALAREPDDRYQLAGDLASDLMQFLVEQVRKPPTRQDVAAFMKATFPEDERRERQQCAAAPVERKATIVCPDPLGHEETTRSGLRPGARTARALLAGAGVLAAALAASIISARVWEVQRPGQPVTPPASLPEAREMPLPGALTVRSAPPGATVYLDGVERGLTPAWLTGVDPSTPHAIALEKRCFHLWQMALPARAGNREIAATLLGRAGACLAQPDLPVPRDPEGAARTLGFLNLGSHPMAGVLIDGVDIGQTTPLVGWPLKPGPHRVKLVLEERSKELAVEIESGRTISELVDLR